MVNKSVHSKVKEKSTCQVLSNVFFVFMLVSCASKKAIFKKKKKTFNDNRYMV